MKRYGKTERLTDMKNLIGKNISIQEKIDGSQFNFKLKNDELRVASSGGFEPGVDDKQFGPAVAHLLSVKVWLVEGLTYYGEVVTKLRHNKLTYERLPKGNIVLFDIREDETDQLFEYAALKAWAEDLKIDVVPQFYYGPSNQAPELTSFMTNESFLGRALIEGIVVKDAKSGLRLKLVSEHFREVKKQVKVNPLSPTDEWMHTLFDSYHTKARFHKAVQHLRDDNQLSATMRDVGPLLKELSQDFETECAEEIKEAFWQKYRKQAIRTVVTDFGKWYSRELSSNLTRTDRP